MNDIASAIHNAEHRLRIDLPNLGKNDLRAVANLLAPLLEMTARAIRAKATAERATETERPAAVAPDPELASFGKIEPQEPAS